MRKAGRQKDAIWKLFDEIPSGQSKVIRARCKECGKELQGLVQRLCYHKLICELLDQPDSEQEEEDSMMVLPEQAVGFGFARAMLLVSIALGKSVIPIYFYCFVICILLIKERGWLIT